MKTKNEILNAILIESEKAETKHPEWPIDPVYAAAIIGEEYGEVMKEAVKLVGNEPDADENKLKQELVQTAAMCLRAIWNLINKRLY